MPEAKTPPRRSAVDTLVARDRTAVFWFLVACGVAAGCAWYVTLMSEVFKERPDFVVMDTSGAYYVPPGIQYIKMDTMHMHLANMMAETLLERTPEGLVYQDRLPKLCLEDALKQIRKKQLEEDDYFTRQKAVQHAEIDPPTILLRTASQVKMKTTGKVHRQSYFTGKEQSEIYTFELITIWKENPSIKINKAFPSRMKEYQLTLTKISDS